MRAAILPIVLLVLTPVAVSQEEAPVSTEAWTGRVELKRQNTNRGTDQESTQTQLRLEAILSGSVAFVRLDLPFPDERTTFEGDATRPRLGDIKVRLGFRRFPVFGLPMTSYVEAAFPTADPQSLGSGKYQLTGGLGYAGPLFPSATESTSTKLFGSAQVSQNVSIAGDETRKDINTTKIEMALLCALGRKPSLKLSFKPNIDWTQDAKTGAVLELEGRVQATRPVAIWLLAGTRLWGAGVPGTYEKKVELGLSWRF